MSGDAGTSPSPAAQAPHGPASPDLDLFRVLASRRTFESELRGPSMGCAIPSGARIRIAPVPSGVAFERGQVVAFVAGSRVIVHRIAYLGRGRAARYLITHGDGNWMCDPPIEADAIAGVVEEHYAEGAWRPVGPPSLPWWRRAASYPSLQLLRMTLELSPALAMRLARAMSYARMSARALWTKLA